MAYKVFLLSNDRKVTIYKRKTSKSLKLSIDSKGQLKISIPIWAPYRAGLEFAKSKEEWINKHHRHTPILSSGQPVGKAHHLQFIVDESKIKPSTRITHNVVQVTHPIEYEYYDPEVQKAAQKACIKALRSQAEALLPQRLQTLAVKHGFTFNEVSIKMLKSRWGSCDQHKNIVLNLFLMQVPWEQIDYVLLHELTHTEILKHGPEFWTEMERLLPNVKSIKRSMREYHPVLNGSHAPVMA